MKIIKILLTLRQFSVKMILKRLLICLIWFVFVFYYLEIQKKARYITKENVQFFLEMIEEEATEEEIKEMIRLCDGGTEGQVTYENFKNLMTY